ncbi:hypothetical protein ACFE04_027451 [Oxalis oulophora]
MKEIITAIKSVAGSNVIFNIIDWDLMRKTVTFEVVNIDNTILLTQVRISSGRNGKQYSSLYFGEVRRYANRKDANGEFGRVKVKRDHSGHVVLYGESFEQFIDRYHLHHHYRMDFQNDGGNQFLMRIRDTQGVEIEYEMRMIDNSRWFQSKKKGTPASLCKMFGEQEVADGYLVLPGIWGKHFPDFTRQEVFLLVGDGSRQFGITHKYRAIFDYRDESSFHLRLVDMDVIEIGYKVGDKMNRKKNVSTLAVPQETSSDNVFIIIDGSDSESDFDGFDVLEAGHMEMIRYYNGFLMGDTFGENGKADFMKKLTAAICIRMQPIYIPRSFVRIHLLSKGQPTVALMCIGDGKKVECNIRWGGASNPGDAYIAGGIPLLMNLIKPDVGQTILFNLVGWEEVKSLVTGAEFVPPGTENVVGRPDDLQQTPPPPAESFTKSYRLS